MRRLVKQNKIDCPKWKYEFSVEKNLKKNKFLQKLLDEQDYLSKKEIFIKQKIEGSIKVFFEMCEESILSKNFLNLDCHNNFQEIRFQFDYHREQLKEKIDYIYKEMIEKTKEFKASYLKNFNAKLEVSLKSLDTKSIEDELKQMKETFRNLNLLIEPIQDMQLKQKNVIKTIKL